MTGHLGMASASASDSAGLFVSALRLYPLKGARGTSVEQMDFAEIGPRWDRRWMVVRPNGDFVTQRDLPKLATVRASVEGDVGAPADAITLTLVAPGIDRLLLRPGCYGAPMRVHIWDSSLTVPTAPNSVSRWLSTVLDGDFRLVFMDENVRRPVDSAYAEGHHVSFADGYPSLIVGEGSVQELGRRVGREIPVERFRPNVVVAGAAPHAEDQWRRLEIADMTFSGVKLCARCKVTTVNQDDGTLDPDSEPLRTLALYRRIEGLVYFGTNLVHHGNGSIKVGDEVKVLERGTVPGAWR